MNMTETVNNENDSYDFEASIQISRILKILSHTIKNAEVALCLPLLLANDSAILQSILPVEQVSLIKEICSKVSQNLAVEQSDQVDELLSVQGDICLVMDLLLSEPKIVEICHKMLSDLCESILPSGLHLLRNLEELRFCAAERLRVTPKMEAQQDAELRRLYQQNIRNKEEVEKLNEKLNKLTLETEQEIEDKKHLIKQQLDKIAQVRKHCRDSVKKKLDEAEKQINWDIKNSEYRLEELQNAAKNAQYRREIQLKEHLNTEKDLRSKRYKVESQLVALLQKYDNDIGERQALLEELTTRFEEEKRQMEVLKEQSEEQEAEYNNLMYEKEQFERQQWEARLYAIHRSVAARKIQRFWRAHRKSKRKSKSGKKGKAQKKGKKK